MSNELPKRVAIDSENSAGVAVSDTRTVKAAIICNNSLIGVGITHLLDGTCFAAAGYAPSIAKAADIYYLSCPDLFIIGAGLSTEETVEAVKHLRETFPEARIVVIADRYDLGLVRLGIDAGVSGFCLTGSSREVLIKSLELIMLGELVLPSALMASLLNESEAIPTPKPQDSRADAKVPSEDPRVRKLSAREAEILGHLMEGAANKVIARKLDVAEATIKVHIKAILRKIGAANRTQAAMWASEHLPIRDHHPSLPN
ncbi:LuxR C-terminal-related transcriptional regulator [Microvirga vignae]|uniref:LuxR C-terminal-related transcriptional regulator n=1 Tax=Microvirga vignae TaxID=1225564 RepID=UPI00069C58FC|nr:response regulator transcription factor [Microvirga vignae]